jgi:hypothetical protein
VGQDVEAALDESPRGHTLVIGSADTCPKVLDGPRVAGVARGTGSSHAGELRLPGRHVIISATITWEDLPQCKEVDLSGLLVEDGIHLGPLHEVWSDDICAPPCDGLFADGPFWDIHVQAKEGLFPRSVSLPSASLARPSGSPSSRPGSPRTRFP